MAGTADTAEAVDTAENAEEGELVGLAGARFPDLTDDERTLVAATASGAVSSFAEPTSIRAELLRWLLTDREAAELVDPLGLRTDNVVVRRPLDLRNADVRMLVRFRRTAFEEGLLLELGRLHALRLEAVTCDLVEAHGVQIDRTLYIHGWDDEPSHIGRVNLSSAQVGGHLVMDGVHIGPPPSVGDAAADAAVSLSQARVGGSLYVNGVGVEGLFDAVDAQIAGNFDAVGSRFKGSPDDPRRLALNLARATIGGFVFLHRPLDEDARWTWIEGSATFWGCQVGRSVNCRGLIVDASRAVRADAGAGAADEGQSDGGQPEEGPPDENGLNLAAARVAGNVLLKEASIDGRLLLSDAQIGEDLVCWPLYVRRAVAEVAEAVDTPAQPTASTGRAGSVRTEAPPPPDVEIRNSSIGGTLHWDGFLPRDGRTSLAGTTTKALAYSSTSSWPGSVDFRDLSFDQISANYVAFRRPRAAWLGKKLGWQPNDEPASGRLRQALHRRAFAGDETYLDWLRLHTRSSYDPALYDRLARAVGSAGATRAATRVLMAKADDGRRARGRVAALLGLPYRVLVGSGYRPGRAAIWTVLLLLVGALVFGAAHDDGTLAAVEPAAERQPFHPVMYSMDTLLPIIDLHQEDSFEVTGPDARGVRAYLWFQITIGWALATSLAAASSKLIQRTAPSP